MPEQGRSTRTPVSDWHPDATEVAAIVTELRPIIIAFAERSRQELAGLTGRTALPRTA